MPCPHCPPGCDSQPFRSPNERRIRPPKSAIERLLSPIADVHRSEAVSALLMTLLMFLLLAAYYLLKTAREVFILTEGGAEIKSYSSAGQAVLLLGLVPAYGAFASRVNRVRLVTWVTLFLRRHLVLFVLAVRAGLHVRHRVLPVGGDLQPHGDRAVLGFAADLYTQGTGQAALSVDRRRQQSRGMGGLGQGGRHRRGDRSHPAADHRRHRARGLRLPRATDRAGHQTIRLAGARRRGRPATGQGGRIRADSQEIATCF